MSERIVMVSGGFSILHVGHVRLIAEASSYGLVVVALNSDDWLERKHPGLTLPAWKERAEVLNALRKVYGVIAFDDRDGTVCDALQTLKPHYFANGGDRTEPHWREHEVCEALGVKELFGIGGGKVTSSSELARAHHENQ